MRFIEKIRAIYIGDVRFDVCPVFELNEENGYFEIINDKEFRYDKNSVYEDNDFLIFSIEDDVAKLIKANFSE